jgi:TonB family protein
MLLMLAIKGGVVLVAALRVTALLRRASAATRHLIWTCAFASLIVLPLLQWSGWRWRVAVPAPAAPILSDAVVVETSTPAPAVPAHHFDWSMLWYAGAALVTLRLLVALIRLRKLVAGARPAPWADDLAGKGARIRESAGVDLPITFGLLRPTILFPHDAADWPLERLRLVMAHELAHVRRFDCLTQLLAEAACAIYWFNPLAWLAASQFRRERERACDDAVLNQGTKSSDYAEHLLGVVKSAHIKGAPIAMAISINSHNLQERLKAVLKPHVNRRAATPRLAAAIAVIALCIVVPIAIVRAQAPETAGNLAGSVLDISGAVVPLAIVVATGLDTHNKEVAYSGPDGTYAFHSLPAGRYTIEVRAGGFAPFHREIVVGAGQPGQLNATVEIGGVQENVDVVGQKPTTTATAIPHTPQRIRVGGNVHATKLVYRVPPVYPEHAKQNGLQGVVVLQAVIGINGSLLSIQPLSKSVDAELVQAARDAVSQWRYEPVLLNGHPVEAVTTITVNFRLESEVSRPR